MHESSAEQCGDAQPHAQLQANAQEERQVRMQERLRVIPRVVPGSRATDCANTKSN